MEVHDIKQDVKRNDRNRDDQITFSALKDMMQELMSSLEKIEEKDCKKKQEIIERTLFKTFKSAPDKVTEGSNEYYQVLSRHLYQDILKHYKHKKKEIITLWRYYKNLSDDQLELQGESNSEMELMNSLVKVYFYSDPLEDLSCIFVPINAQASKNGGDNDINKTKVGEYLGWIKNYFYNVNYPTSLLWLYALDSSLASLFPDEIVYLGKLKEKNGNMVTPDFGYKDTVLLKRFSSKSRHFVELRGEDANNEFRQIFTFLKQEHQDRCLSHSANQEDQERNETIVEDELNKFRNVLKFGVADDNESGCISFSDLRASTEFLNTYGKDDYLNKIQQPFFESTKLISERYAGRIDKFMGDNVMCVFLDSHMEGQTDPEKQREAVLNNFFALFSLCKGLCDLILEKGVLESDRLGFADSNLGLRSGVTYGDEISRANLGNDILRDFTVTGETVNLAARLEHISIPELLIHNRAYFEKTIERFPQIRELMTIGGNAENLSPETERIIEDFTLYQNIVSNLEELAKVKFDIRFNDRYYCRLRDHFRAKGYKLQNPDTAKIHGYEEYHVDKFEFKFYFSYYAPKGFMGYKKIWILPLPIEILENLDVEMIK